MKTLQQIKEIFRSKSIPDLNLNILIQKNFITKSFLLANSSEEQTKLDTCIELTRENVLRALEISVKEGFEKALLADKYAQDDFIAVEKFNWILEEGLEDFQEYPLFGLPLFKATALKYGFPNPIGDDKGNEYYYLKECEEEEN